MNAFIFHGTAGHPQENWFPWLKEQLEAKGIPTIVPQFPTPEGQSFEAWMKILEQDLGKIGPDTILIGHSLGGEFLLKLLEQITDPVKLSVTVGAPIGVLPIGNYDRDAKFIGGFNFNWEKIKLASKNFIVYHSDNDPYVGLGNGQELAKQLGIELSFIPNAGHFNQAAGYTKFDHLLNQLNKLLNI